VHLSSAYPSRRHSISRSRNQHRTRSLCMSERHGGQAKGPLMCRLQRRASRAEVQAAPHQVSWISRKAAPPADARCSSVRLAQPLQLARERGAMDGRELCDSPFVCKPTTNLRTGQHVAMEGTSTFRDSPTPSIPCSGPELSARLVGARLTSTSIGSSGAGARCSAPPAN